MRTRSIVATLLTLVLANHLWAQVSRKKDGVSFSRASGGSIQTKLSANIIVNKNSSLNREWITMHDAGLPVDLEGTVGVTTCMYRTASVASTSIRPSS
jgi:hypothetical protein